MLPDTHKEITRRFCFRTTIKFGFIKRYSKTPETLGKIIGFLIYPKEILYFASRKVNFFDLSSRKLTNSDFASSKAKQILTSLLDERNKFLLRFQRSDKFLLHFQQSKMNFNSSSRKLTIFYFACSKAKQILTSLPEKAKHVFTSGSRKVTKFDFPSIKAKQFLTSLPKKRNKFLLLFQKSNKFWLRYHQSETNSYFGSNKVKRIRFQQSETNPYSQNVMLFPNLLPGERSFFKNSLPEKLNSSISFLEKGSFPTLLLQKNNCLSVAPKGSKYSNTAGSKAKEPYQSLTIK